MDQPNLDPRLHTGALGGLRRVNRLSATASHLWHPIARLAAEIPDRPVRILDLGSGGGDVALGIARQAQRARVSVRIEGWDISPVAVEYARTQARAAQYVNVAFLVRDALKQPVEADFDVVTCSLFLHHLEDVDAVRMLSAMSMVARHLVLVDDLHRTWLGYLLAWAGCRLLTRSPVVRVDGPRSVAAAFSLREITALATQAGLAGCSVRRHWPERFLLSWRKS